MWDDDENTTAVDVLTWVLIFLGIGALGWCAYMLTMSIGEAIW